MTQTAAIRIAIAALAAVVASLLAVTPGGVSGLTQRYRDQQLPEVVTTGQLKVVALLSDAEARIHALEHVVFVRSLQELLVEVTTSQVEQSRCIAFPKAARRVVAQARVFRAHVLDQSGDGSMRFHLWCPSSFRRGWRRINRE